jgi:hypothetical protein
MGQTKKAKVMFTCEWETKDFLTKWANAENRTLSNLVETLITEAIATKQAQQSETPAPEPSTGGKGKGK